MPLTHKSELVDVVVRMPLKADHLRSTGATVSVFEYDAITGTIPVVLKIYNQVSFLLQVYISSRIAAYQLFVTEYAYSELFLIHWFICKYLIKCVKVHIFTCTKSKVWSGLAGGVFVF